MMLKVLHKELIDHAKVINEYDRQILILIKILTFQLVVMIVNEQEVTPKEKKHC